MPDVPSIKGSIFSYHASQLLKLASSGVISRDELAQRLEPGDLEIIEDRIHATQWVDIRLYERVLRLRCNLEGDGTDECLQQYGAQSAENVIQSGVYQQLDYLKRTQVSKQTETESRFQAFGRDLRLLTTLVSAAFNFVRHEVTVDSEWSDRYVIELSEASAFPEVLCWTTQGFFNRMAVEHDHPDLWRWERPAPDRVVFRMTRSP